MTRPRFTVAGAAYYTIMLLLMVPGDSLGTVPFVPFSKVVRDSDCVYVADYSSEKKSEDNRRYVFRPTATVLGQGCSDGEISVFRSSDESPITLADGTYVLFLMKREGSTYIYTKEPFSILRVKDGKVGTILFRELGEELPLEKVLTRIRRERGR